MNKVFISHGPFFPIFTIYIHDLSISNRLIIFSLLAIPDRIDNDKIMPSAITASSGGPQLHHQEDLNQECGIRDVWRHNLEEEFVLIRKIVNKYCYVAMDTEFPGEFIRSSEETCLYKTFF